MTTMTLKEALAHADKCEKDGVISTSGKALIVLAEEIRKMQVSESLRTACKAEFNPKK